jgi:hypothetical protein
MERRLYRLEERMKRCGEERKGDRGVYGLDGH